MASFFPERVSTETRRPTGARSSQRPCTPMGRKLVRSTSSPSSSFVIYTPHCQPSSLSLARTVDFDSNDIDFESTMGSMSFSQRVHDRIEGSPFPSIRSTEILYERLIMAVGLHPTARNLTDLRVINFSIDH